MLILLRATYQEENLITYTEGRYQTALYSHSLLLPCICRYKWQSQSCVLPNHVMCLLSQARVFLVAVSSAPRQGILQKALTWAPTLKSALLSRRMPPKLSLASAGRKVTLQWSWHGGTAVLSSHMTSVFIWYSGVCGISITTFVVNLSIQYSPCL